MKHWKLKREECEEEEEEEKEEEEEEEEHTCGVSPSGIASTVSCSLMYCLSLYRHRLCTIS
jgi:hypothetical protein